MVSIPEIPIKVNTDAAATVPGAVLSPHTFFGVRMLVAIRVHDWEDIPEESLL